MTSFDDIFDMFFSKIHDSELLSMPDDEIDDNLTKFLLSAITNFRSCQRDLNSYDTVAMIFNIDLTLDDINILAELMVYEYINKNIKRIELMKQSLSSKDYAMYSQANHISALLSLKEAQRVETRRMLREYSYDFGDLGGLRNGI